MLTIKENILDSKMAIYINNDCKFKKYTIIMFASRTWQPECGNQLMTSKYYDFVLDM